MPKPRVNFTRFHGVFAPNSKPRAQVEALGEIGLFQSPPIPLAGVFAAILIAIVLVFATGLFSNLPMAVLAATIINAAIGLVDIKTLRHTWHYDRAEGVALLGTLLGVPLAGVEQ